MTLVEMMFALVISVMVLGVSVGFLVEATRATLRVQSNTQNDLTEWGIYAGITIDTRIANGMTLYKDFNAASFLDHTYRITDKTSTVTNSATRGDFLVLSQSTQDPGSSVTSYSALTGYLYTAGAPGKGTFTKFTFLVPSAEKNHDLETILSAHYNQFVFRTVATGLDATHSDNATTGAQNRAFQYRSTVSNSGVLNLEVSTGYANVRTADKKLIETAFFIRR